MMHRHQIPRPDHLGRAILIPAYCCYNLTMNEAEKFLPERAEDFVAPETGSLVIPGNSPEAESVSSTEVVTDSEANNAQPEPEQLQQSEGETDLKLTPELQQLILDKLKDINESGTAFSNLSFHTDSSRGEASYEKLFYALRQGLLGEGGSGSFDAPGEQRAESWHKKVRSRDDTLQPKVWFNIVGRIKGVYGKDQIQKATPGRSTSIIFDIDKFSELLPGSLGRVTEVNNVSNSPRKFSAVTQRSVTELIMPEALVPYWKSLVEKRYGSQLTNSGRTDYKVHRWAGFAALHRIPPRIFQGIVVGESDMENLDGIIKTMIGAYTDKPEMLLPIYDESGNLLWPQRLPYEELKDRLEQNSSESDPELGK